MCSSLDGRGAAVVLCHLVEIQPPQQVKAAEESLDLRVRACKERRLHGITLGVSLDREEVQEQSSGYTNIRG